MTEIAKLTRLGCDSGSRLLVGAHGDAQRVRNRPHPAAADKRAEMISRRSSASIRAESAVEPTRSENITVTWRRSAASILAEADGAKAAVSDVGVFNSAIARNSRRR